MVAIAPFKAIRFNPAKVSNLANVICPPYDVISVADYHKLMGRSPQNIVRVELPMGHEKGDRYALAAQHWDKWQKKRILVQDKQEAFYAYEQRFTLGTKPQFRRGFFAALKVERPGKGHIRPHERTFSKHKEDRLKLMRATKANVSPIFGIFFDQEQKAQRMLNRIMKSKPDVTSRDDKSITHRMWRITDKAVIQTLTQVLAKEDVLIADGHHRYETAWNYAQEKIARTKASPKSAFRYVMTFLCPLSDPGLVIHPTHRMIRFKATWEEWQARIEPHFEMERISSLKPLLSKLRAPRQHSAFGMVLEGGKLLWLTPKHAADLQLPVELLHEKLLSDIPLEDVSFGQDVHQIIQTIQRGEANAAFLLAPPDKEIFAKICKSGRLLPQKSTYFFPKLATGLVMRSVSGDV